MVTTVRCLELFTFEDGTTRPAWVRWQIGAGERRCIGLDYSVERAPLTLAQWLSSKPSFGRTPA